VKSELFKRLSILIGVVILVLGFILLFTFDIIKINWNSFMKIQPAFQPMYNPLPVPADSIPIEGPAFGAELAEFSNPVPADLASETRGKELFQIVCISCHGKQGKGDGLVSTHLQNKPANLTSLPVQFLSDAAIFMTISNGVKGKMPALNENLTVRERWDVVNYIRRLK
jgi:mono/diheme cytochrome c family protein